MLTVSPTGVTSPASGIDVSTLELLPDGVIIYRIEGCAHLLYANEAAIRLCGCTSFDEMYEHCHGDFTRFFHPDDYRYHLSMINVAWHNATMHRHHVQYRIIAKGGHVKLIDDSGSVSVLGDAGECVICILTQMDENVTYSLEQGDKLTGLLGVGQFVQCCETFLKEREAEGDTSGYHIAFFNIRHFKGYNVEHGSKQGDKVLRSLADIIKKWSTTKVVTRLSGDQFVAISESHEMYDRIRRVIDEFTMEYGSTGLSVDVGIYPLKSSEEDIHVACDFAKTACDSIRNSREDVCVYNDELSRKLRVSSYVISHLDEAIEKGCIRVFYQPVVRSITGALCGMEALARWIDPVQGFLSPADFIEVLEENHLITKLDLYVFRTICAEMHEAQEKRRTLIPVSFNLSRIDFLDCDVFDEIEAVVKEYGVARDLINIEITESTVMGNQSLPRHDIDRFRGAGYNVWMDDFGSGYSSLNVLKDFEFDEIKLDMAFMRDFNERSRNLVRSIIRMAKELGIATLAEGVETREQYEFLREVGCERLQGYLFGKPLPIDELMQHCVDNDVEVEGRKWRRYYDALGTVDFITERTLGVFEFDGQSFTRLFSNDAFFSVFKNTGVASAQAVLDIFNSPLSPISRQLREAQQALVPGGEALRVDHIVNGQYLRFGLRCVSREQGRTLSLVEVHNISNDENRSEREQLDGIYRTIYAMYDSIFLVDIANNSMRAMARSAYYGGSETAGMFVEGKPIDTARVAEVLIHRDDRRDFMAFADKDTVLRRIRQGNRGYITDLFRSRTASGTYAWKAHTIVYSPESGTIIYCVHHTPIQNSSAIGKLLPQAGDSVHADGMGGAVWQALGGYSQTLNVFWKDRDRRFVGANERFLDTFGFSSLAEIVGKTDEDMQWHADNEPFRDDELEVLNNGAVIRNAVGQCIVHGAMKKIISSKEPIYRDGEIVGLLGTFIVADELGADAGLTNGLGERDEPSSLMTSQGIVNVVSGFADAWQFHQEPFAILRLNFPEYYRALVNYGYREAKAILATIGTCISEVIRREFKTSAIAGRLFSANFTVIVKYREKDDVTRLMQSLERAFDQVRRVNGLAVTLTPTIKHCFVNDDQSLSDVISFATGGVVEDGGERIRWEEQIQNYKLQMETVVNALPGGIQLSEITLDRSGRMTGNKVVYLSDGVAALSGRKASDFFGVISDDEKIGVCASDSARARAAIETAIREGRATNTVLRIRHVNGKVVWTNMHANVIGTENGHPLVMMVYLNNSNAAASFESVLDEAQVGVVISDRDSGETFLSNRYAQSLRDHLFGSSTDQMLGVLDGGRPLDAAGQPADGAAYEVVHQNRHLSVRQTRTTWNERAANACYITDVTDKYRDEEAAREILEQIPASVVVFTASKDGEYRKMFLSDRALSIVDLDRTKNGAFDTIMSFVHPDDTQVVYEAIERCLRSDHTVSAEYRIMGKGGVVIWTHLRLSSRVQQDGSYVVYGVYSDVTGAHAIKEAS